MPDKGRIMSQVYYERQSKLIELYKECIIKKEMNVNEAIISLRLIGFSKAMAASRVREWAAQSNTDNTETSKTAKQKFKQRAALEKYMLRMGLGKNYDKYVKLQKKYLNKELTENKYKTELMQLGYSREFAEYMVGKLDKTN